MRSVKTEHHFSLDSFSMFAYIALVGESQEPDADVISAVFTSMVNRRWARKTKAEKLAFGRALTAARMKKQRKAKGKKR